MKIRKNILLTLLFVVLAIVLMGLLFQSSITAVPNTASTKGILNTLSRRIRRYVKLNNDIPDNLSNLPILKGFGDETEDAWGNDITYVVNGSEVTLTSLGRDGKTGGEGEDADITSIFNAYENLDDPFCVVLFPQYITYYTMSCIATRIQIYVSNNGELPDDMSNLPELKPPTSDDPMRLSIFQNITIDRFSKESLNKTVDHWGKDIDYQRTSPTKFRLFSYGEDSNEGGIGQYSDMERIFELDDKRECVEIHFNLRDR